MRQAGDSWRLLAKRCMNQRRVDINLKPTGWLGWLMVALLAVPLLVLAFFFVAFAAVLLAVMLALAVGRMFWQTHKVRSHESSASHSSRGRGRRQSGEVIDVEPIDARRAGDATNAAPLNARPPARRG